MTQNYRDFYDEYVPLISKQMATDLATLDAPAVLKEAMLYSINAGGKRLRPLMTLAIYHAFGHTIDTSIIRVASALELVHTYSLIHDDLPAMDNDDLRRGLPTSHKRFGEANAILAGDALLTQAFVWLANNQLPATVQVQLVRQLAVAAGATGMVGGQVEDMLGAQKTYDLSELQQVHNRKTGALLSYATQAGALMAQVDVAIVKQLGEFGQVYGLAFQIQDDLLDVTDNTDFERNTYPKLLGLDGAKAALQTNVEHARQIIEQIAATVTFDHELVSGFLSYFERKN
ncbi:polyprenyl synthetase family protein [Periweissella cryptocerci]|uniref:Farnesyl diphosphate synthase n=1 Tax=Periweissella cryptocerci TaxID=2506420 RepID=A0A4P6YVD7_9LACO|nr:farnesyl diphosphate synthase [Periweissella cryptocerci]QBO36754.1 polyprenyl synthetase family protein [Periweissella cryptocerci]